MKSKINALFATVLSLAPTALGQALPTAEPREVGMSAEGISKIDPFVQRYIDERRLAGAVTIVAKGGKVIHFSAKGMQDIGADKPMRKDTLFRIYSMTKAVASVAAMVLGEEGKLGLDDPVSKYIPAAGRMKFEGEPQTRQMTVRDLLRHTAGFSNNVTVDSAFRRAGLPPLHESTLEEMMNRLDAVPMRYQPGTDWHYSFGTEVLARVLEVASGQTLDVCIAEKVCKPLGMIDTAFFVPEEKRHRLAEVYGRNLKVVAAPQPGTRGAYTFDKLPKFLSAGGGLVSTATDYMRFCLMLSNKGVLDGKRFLKTETVEAMIRDQLPESVGEIDRRPEGRGFGLGFAVRTRKIASAPSSVGEYEWLGGAGTEYWLSPKDELVVITLTQQMPMIELGQALKPIVYSALSDEKETAANAVSRDRYLLLDSRIIDSTANAKLALGSVKKHTANPLFVADKPWEPRYDNMYPNVIFDAEEQLYKCWYCPFIVDERTTMTPPAKRNPNSTQYMSAKPNKRDEAILYATSKDGIHWEKPELGLVEFGGNKRNNIVVRGPSGAGVHKDLHENNPARRYKAFYAAQVGYMQLIRFSPDGLNWGPEIRCPEIAIQSDCHANMVWSPELQKYVGIVRHYDRFPVVGNRKIARTESADGLKWTRSELIIEGTPKNQMHDMVIFRAGGVFLGLLGVMDYPSVKSMEGVRQQIELAWSPDSYTWHRILPGTPLIANTSAKTKEYGTMPYDWGAMFPSQPVFRENEVQIFYGASDWYFFDWRKSGLALATLRPDGWAGFEPSDAANHAIVTTTSIDCSRGQLRVSVDVHSGGWLKVTALDETGKQQATSRTITRTGSDTVIDWSGDFDLQKAKVIRLKFEFAKAKLYSFSFGN